jgi:hypothetical protein
MEKEGNYIKGKNGASKKEGINLNKDGKEPIN